MNKIDQPGFTVFLCHGKEDKPKIRSLYKDLAAANVQPWLDEVNIIPGQDWNLEIRRAVRNCHAILVCLSKQTVSKSGFLQKEIRHALDVADEKPEGSIFIVPVKIDDCEIPDRLQKWQWVNLYEENGFPRLLEALHIRAKQCNINIISHVNDDKNKKEQIQCHLIVDANSVFRGNEDAFDISITIDNVRTDIINFRSSKTTLLPINFGTHSIKLSYKIYRIRYTASTARFSVNTEVSYNESGETAVKTIKFEPGFYYTLRLKRVEHSHSFWELISASDIKIEYLIELDTKPI